jgi:dTDP-4-dehydrorhamnose 3,5-epimerase
MMETIALPTPLAGVLVVEIKYSRDERGFFIESYHRRQFAAIGIADEFVQDNHSRSAAGVLRGVHYQDMRAPMGKLVRCTRGAIFDVAVDLRAGSPTFGQWFGLELSEDNMKQLWLPVGFGHAFYTLTAVADVQYKCTNFYASQAEGAIAWNDPDLAIDWPAQNPILSQRDINAPSLKQYQARPAFLYHPA